MRDKLLLLLAMIAQFVYCQNEIIRIPLSRRQGDTYTNQRVLQISQNDDINANKLTNYLQVMYYGDIQVGNSNKTLNVIFDTGSNTLWIPSKQCIQTSNCKGFYNYYSCELQDGCTSQNLPGSIQYGKGEVIGQYFTTKIGVCNLPQVQQEILLVDQASNFSNIQSDGLFGLGVYDIQNQGSNSFVTNLKQNNIIKNDIFSFYLGFGRSDSELIFGGFNTNKLVNSSQIYYHSVKLNGKKDATQRWALQMKSFKMGGGYYFDFPIINNIGIVDSGTSFLALTNSIYSPFVSYLVNAYDFYQRGDGFYYISCSANLPDITFTMLDVNNKEIEYSLPSSFYLMSSGSQCILTLQQINIQGVQIILGNVFMRRYLSIFSYNNQTVGLSLSVANPDDDYVKDLEQWAVILIILGGCLVIAGIAFCLYRKAKERRDRNRAYLSQQLLIQNQQGQQNNLNFGGAANLQYVPPVQSQDFVYGRPVQGFQPQPNNYQQPAYQPQN